MTEGQQSSSRETSTENSGADLIAAVEAFCDYAQLQADEDKAWGVKEVLAHLIRWQLILITQSVAIRFGEKPHPPPGRADDINALAVAAARGLPLAFQISEFKRVSQRLVAELRDPATNAKTFKLMRNSSVRKPLHQHVRSEAAHIRAHLRSLKRQDERDPKREARQLNDVMLRFSGSVADSLNAAIVPAVSKPQVLEAIALQQHYLKQVQERRAFSVTGAELAPAIEVLERLALRDLLARQEANRIGLNKALAHLDPQQVVIAVLVGRVWHRTTLDDAARRIAAHAKRLVSAQNRAGQRK